MFLVHVIVTLFLAGGIFFLLVGSIGLLRFPDFYTRLHATGKSDTLGAGLMILLLSSPRRRGPILRSLSIGYGVWVPGLASLARDDSER